MVVGNGLLARAFASRYLHHKEVTIFASGVSNSGEADPAAFARERLLLGPLLSRDSLVVYFGSCGSVSGDASSDTPYMRHKRAMETWVAESENGLVLRLPQVVGHTRNPNTLTNFLRDRILAGERFTVWANAERNLIDVEDIVAIASHLIDTRAYTRRVLSIASARSLPMSTIVEIFERVLERKAVFTAEPLGGPLRIETAEAAKAARALGIDLDGNYVESIIRKYYEPTT